MNAREREQQQQRRQSASDWASSETAYVPTSVKRPDGVKQYKMEEGENRFDVIPFRAGYGNPKADAGVEQWNRVLGRHTLPSSSEFGTPYNCLYETWKKPCPICRHLSNRSDVTLDQIINKEGTTLRDSMRAKKRLLLVVNDRPGDASNALKLFDANWYNRKLGFGEQLQMAAQALRPDADFFFDLGRADGRTLVVRVEPDKYKKVSRIDFVRRNYDYPATLMDSAPCLDDCLILMRPDHLKDVPIHELSNEDWREVYNYLEALMNGEVSAPAPAKATPPREDAPARETTPARETSVSSNGPSRTTEPKPAPREVVREAAKEVTKVDLAPAAKGTVAPYKKGDEVLYHGLPCVVKFVEGGRLLTLKDEEGELYEDVPLAAVKPISGGKKVEEKAPAKPAPARATSKVVPDDDEKDLDEMDEDEEPPY